MNGEFQPQKIAPSKKKKKKEEEERKKKKQKKRKLKQAHTNAGLNYQIQLLLLFAEHTLPEPENKTADYRRHSMQARTLPRQQNETLRQGQ